VIGEGHRHAHTVAKYKNVAKLNPTSKNMKKTFLFLLVAAAFSAGAVAESAPASTTTPPAAKLSEKDLIEQLKKSYPLKTCIVSNAPLNGSMGKSIDYLYTDKDGKPHLFVLCCTGCIKTIKKNPDKYVKLLDEATAKAAASAK